MSSLSINIEKIKIQGANAISSPITYGFPAITGILGAMHSLTRKLSKHSKIDLNMQGVLIACHDIHINIFKEDYNNKFNITRNPIKKDGTPSSFIEEAKANLELSLIVKLNFDNHRDQLSFKKIYDNKGMPEILNILMQQRIAGGSIFSIENIEFNKKELPPCFILMDAKKELIEITKKLQSEDPNKNALDALIETAKLHSIPKKEENDSEIKWDKENIKTGYGILTPMPVGYQAIYPEFEPAQLQNCRNPEYPSQYVETLYSLGKWVSMKSIDNINSAFWSYHNDNEIYLTTQNKGDF